MYDVLVATAISFGVIFVAELGDKSQLMALTFATRFRMTPVLIGITVATSVVHLVSVAVGHGLGAAMPTGWIALVAAIAFLGFGAWTLRGDSLSADEQNKASRVGRSAVMAVTVAFFLAELGDKTMLATITLATQHGWFGVWLGSTLGMVVADALAIVVGRQLGKRLPERTIRYGAAGLFGVFGVWLAADAVQELTGEPIGAFFDHHAAGWIALVLAVAGIVLGVRYRRAASARPTLGASRRFGSAAWWVRALSAVAAVLGLAAPLLVAVDVIQPLSLFSDPGIAVAGAGVFLGGFALWRAAMASLVACGRRTQGRPGFAAKGLHARIRYPGLTGVVVATTGLLLMVPTVMGVLAMVLIVVAVQIQARAVREPRLAAQFGAAYAGYVLRSGRFLPRLRPAESPGLRDRVRVG
ncbi:TMEM165/GDT1 family protein [Pseudonocardia sp. N23]|uniref:TMEM165/GDT1 family protein n=1 Tax=Pseudonocardia sp. N23 TaxID=1987376 RepID=UPI000BFC98A0|nr:TMEM165/GDT1 family protein [Pseudonocardia sp. N23]GAY08201.1 probable transmembrane protein [Pseudonocardia sp. N23]